MTAPQPAPCPHCGEMMPPGFLFCRPCSQELTWDIKVELWTSQSRAHFPKDFPLGPHRFTQAQAAALFHLRQHSSAVL